MTWKKQPEMNTRQVEILNALKNEHGRRETEITELLRRFRDPVGYLNKITVEDDSYKAILAAVDVYFQEKKES